MKERLERLKVVKSLIKTHRIDSQDSLLQLLAEAGYSVTQATLSRDLKYLKVGKVAWNESIVVVRTFSGHSDSVALAIDNMGMEDVLGTISGRDNVVFVALRKGSRGDDFIAALKGKIPEFDPE